MKKKLYLANPYGFSQQTKKLLNEFIYIFNDLNVEVYEPFERTKNMGKISAWYDNEWGFSNRMCDIAEYLHKIS